uniref:Acetyl-coenzyme A carboxylase carboxyl transferase subunit beta, chloroplastic n=1 Tax=Pleurastrum terricola TaxID=34116 RepID=A6YG56_PLETE|nr:acetyl-CoA carboxylase beta subunit [Pleurastrum terricola]ABO69279.1 beta subunit of acetyl-CoA carboxylase carboxytransferase [Pleurastrum terricola]
MTLINRIDQLTNREDKAKFFQEVRMIDNPLATDIKRARELEQIEREERFKAFAEARQNNDIEKAMDTSQPLWVCCKFCHYNNFKKHLRERLYICVHCSAYLPMSSYDRVDHLIDKGTWQELDETLSPIDTLKFFDDFSYAERLYDSQKETKMLDAVITGFGILDGYPVAIGVMDFHFMGGSMGAVVGEKITRLIEFATYKALPLILVCASGGARMQEGALSLMQMAKISAALEIYHTYAKLFHISVLTSPTTGGVTASFGMLADLVIAEPNAVIAFAGKRIIENILNMEVSAEFQTAENMFNHGIIDHIIPRDQLKGVLSEFLRFHVNNETPFKHAGHLPRFQTMSYSLLNQEKYRLSIDQKLKSNKNLISTTLNTSKNDKIDINQKFDLNLESLNLDLLNSQPHSNFRTNGTNRTDKLETIPSKQQQLVAQVEKSLLEISALIFRSMNSISNVEEGMSYKVSRKASGFNLSVGTGKYFSVQSQKQDSTFNQSLTDKTKHKPLVLSEEGKISISTAGNSNIGMSRQAKTINTLNIAKQKSNLYFSIAAKKRRILTILQNKRNLLTRAETQELIKIDSFLQLQIKPRLQSLLDLDIYSNN